MDDQEKWRAELRSPDQAIRAAAAENLCHAGAEAAGAAIDLLIACGDEEAVSNWAVAALEDLGPPELEALEPLSDLVSSPNPLIAYWATTLLGRLGPPAATSQDAIADALLKSKDLAVQERCAWALGKIGASSGGALMALNQAAESRDQRLAQLAEAALSKTKKLVD
jgi:HEAT repeat protein